MALIQFDRPEEPASFKAEDHTGKKTTIELDREAVQATIKAGHNPEWKDKHWRDRKPEFAKAQYNKCGYCEQKIISSHYGDVEHFAPKSEVGDFEIELDETGEHQACLGREMPDSANVTGRKIKAISPTGYWFRAYEWDNYLLACQSCNQIWKRTLFPVADSPRTLPPEKDVSETRLLLNCFDDDPTGHFEFDELGQIKGETEKGKQTIQVCGLDRESLRDARFEKASDAFRAIKEFYKTNELKDLSPLLRAGRQDMAYAGMIRSILSGFGISYADLEELLAQ